MPTVYGMSKLWAMKELHLRAVYNIYIDIIFCHWLSTSAARQALLGG